MSADLTGARWFKSTFSRAGGDCVEIAHLEGGHTAVRDSKDPVGPVLDFTPSEWTAFVAGVKAGEFYQA
ncbi:DUF397 domain-containing protein [Nocardia jiangsuensis]|uniref:DUF397 domain-containing protein n=1 Tax=Nocardia jiangsuensis TaxID=1691563 RepID=A0ABV8DU11_9NOCA